MFPHIHICINIHMCICIYICAGTYMSLYMYTFSSITFSPWISHSEKHYFAATRLVSVLYFIKRRKWLVLQFCLSVYSSMASNHYLSRMTLTFSFSCVHLTSTGIHHICTTSFTFSYS